MRPLLGLMGRSRRVPLNNWFGIIGDSNSVAGGDLNGTVRHWNTSGGVGSFFTWACSLPSSGGAPGGRMVHAGVSALGGVTMAQIRSTYWPTMRDATPKRGFVVILGMTNDLGAISPSGVLSQPALDARMADLEAIVVDALVNGIIPVVCSVPPSSTVNNQTAVLAIRSAVFALSIKYAIPYADLYGPVGDGSGGWVNASDHAGDGIHPSTAGAIKMGQALRDAVDSWLLPGYPKLVTTGDDTTGWKWLGGRFVADGNVNGRPDGGFIALVTDTWGVPTNTAAMSLVATSGGDVDGNWLQVSKTGTPASSSTSTTGATGNAPLNTQLTDVYETTFRFKFANFSGASADLSPTLTLVDSDNGANTVFSWTAYGQGASGGPYTLAVLGRKPPSASTYRWSYGMAVRNTGGTGDVLIGQLTVRQVA